MIGSVIHLSSTNGNIFKGSPGLLHHPPRNGFAEGPTGGMALKTEFLRLFWLSDTERVLSVNGLGDSKPSELMENMLALLGSGDASFLFVQLFLCQLPPAVHTALDNPLASEDERLLQERG